MSLSRDTCRSQFRDLHSHRLLPCPLSIVRFSGAQLYAAVASGLTFFHCCGSLWSLPALGSSLRMPPCHMQFTSLIFDSIFTNPHSCCNGPLFYACLGPEHRVLLPVSSVAQACSDEVENVLQGQYCTAWISFIGEYCLHIVKIFSFWTESHLNLSGLSLIQQAKGSSTRQKRRGDMSQSYMVPILTYGHTYNFYLSTQDLCETTWPMPGTQSPDKNPFSI